MKEDKDDHPLAYPKPTETDSQMKEQGEYLQRDSSRLTTQQSGNDAEQDIQQMKDANGQDETEGIP
ncbi:MAG: hypothetical protein JWP69_2432 [Flaviaesturariibacter sp.]|nr:hypothetical protein [Flaviaesturariibacter sp.]